MCFRLLLARDCRKPVIVLRTSDGFLTITMFPLAIAIWFGDPDAMAACGTTVGDVGDVTVGEVTVAAAAACGALAICTRFPFMFNTEKVTFSKNQAIH